MKHLSSISLLLFLFLSAFSLQAQTAADEKAIKAIIDEGLEATYAADVDRITNLYADDAVMIPYMGLKFVGKDAIRQAMIQWFQYEKPEPGSTNITVSHLRFLTPDRALVVMDLNGKSVVDGKTIEWQGVGTMLCAKKNGKWLVELDQSTPVMPMPGAEGSK